MLNHDLTLDLQHKFWMDLALKNAKLALQNNEVPVGAVLIKDQKLIASGFNQTITQTDPTAHAEILAIRQAAQKINNYRLLDTSLYVTLEPCAMCVGAIIHARISRVIFGAFDAKTGMAGSVDNLFIADFANHKPEVVGGVNYQQCGEILSQFFKSKRIK